MRRIRTVAVFPTMFTLGNLVCGFFAIVVAARIDAPTSETVSRPVVSSDIDFKHPTGVMRQLDPNFDLFSAAAPTVQRKMAARFSLGGFRKKAETLGASFYGVATELPSLIHLMLVRLKQGKVTVEIEIKGIDKLTHGIERAAARVSIAIVVAAFAIQVAPRLVDLGTPFFATVTAMVAIFGIGWVWLLRRKKF